MLNRLIKTADALDALGMHKEAAELDNLILSLASQTVTLKQLEEITKQDLTDTAKEMITFELAIETHKETGGNVLKAIPKLHDKWTDGLMLGDASQYNLSGE